MKPDGTYIGISRVKSKPFQLFKLSVLLAKCLHPLAPMVVVVVMMMMIMIMMKEM